MVPWGGMDKVSSVPVKPAARGLLGREAFAPPCTLVPLERRPVPAEAEFLRVYYGKRPVILTGVFADRPSAGWTLDSLARDFGALPAQLQSFRRPFPSVWRLVGEGQSDLPLAQALDRLQGGCGAVRIAIPVVLPAADELMRRFREALPAPPYTLGRLESYNSFFTSSHVSWGLHHDIGTEQMLFQLIGRKAVLLVSDDRKCTRAIAPVRYPGAAFFRSQLTDIERVDTKLFPRFPEAIAHVGVLEPGDALYMPCAWWHDTRPLGPAFSLNMRHAAPRVPRTVSRLTSRLYSWMYGDTITQAAPNNV